MPVEPINTGDGTIAYPYGLNNTGVQTAGMNPNATWAARSISQYNRPTISQDDYAAAQASEWSGRILEDAIARAQEAERAARAQAQEEQIVGLFGEQARNAPITGLYGLVSDYYAGIGGLASGYVQSQMNIAGSVGEQFSAAVAAEDQASITRETAAPKPKGPDKPGYIQQPVYDYAGRVREYKYVPISAPSKPKLAVDIPEAATQLDQNIGAVQDAAVQRNANVLTDEDYYRGARRFMQQRTRDDWNIYQRAAFYRDSYEANKRAVAIEMYGQPQQITSNGKVTGEDWAANGVAYYGLLPGEVVGVPVDPPADDAPYEDWVKYENRMQRAIHPALYKVGSARPEIYAMTMDTYKDFQRALRAAGYYPPGERVRIGFKTDFEFSKMESLMADANVNGMTWRQVLQAEIEGYQQQLESGGLGAGGGGGGGGGGTTSYTQTQYSQTSMATARALLASVLQRTFGRAPSDDEVKRFLKILNDAESGSPTITTTQTSTAGGATTSTSRTTPSAIDEEQMALQFAKEIQGGKPYQAGTAENYIAGLIQYLGG